MAKNGMSGRQRFERFSEKTATIDRTATERKRRERDARRERERAVTTHVTRDNKRDVTRDGLTLTGVTVESGRRSRDASPAAAGARRQRRSHDRGRRRERA